MQIHVTCPHQAHTTILKVLDAMCGPEPSKLDVGVGAGSVREKRRALGDVLYQLANHCLKAGATQAREQMLRQQAIAAKAANDARAPQEG